jgi:hypothetical protein
MSVDQLFVTGLDGTARRLRFGGLSYSDEAGYYTPAWSPDGHLIAVQSARGIGLVNSATGAFRLLTRDGGLHPSWSPDGRDLTYMLPRDSNGDEWDIAVVGADGSGQRQLTHWFPDGGSNTDPVWSAAYLAFGMADERLNGVSLPRGPRLVLRGTVTRLTAEGRRVAFTVGDCDSLIWDVHSSAQQIRACYDPDSSTVSTKLLALAGQTVVWVVDNETIDQYEYALLARPPYNRQTQLAYLYSDDTGGDAIDRLLASRRGVVFDVVSFAHDGTVLSHHTWAVNPNRLRGDSRCPDDGSDTGSVSVLRCHLLSPAPHARLLALAGSSVVERAARGRVLVATLAGKVIRSWRLPDGYPLSASLDGNTLDVLDGRTLRHYDIASGKLLIRRRIGPALVPATLVGAAPGLVAYLRGATLHLLRLGDGTDITLVPDRQADANLLAQLDNAGLFYAYDRSGTGPGGRLDFLPLNTVRGLFAKPRTH